MTGLAQVNMNINEARRDDHPTGINDLIGLAVKFSRGSDFGNAAIGEQEIVWSIDVLGRIEKAAVFDGD